MGRLSGATCDASRRDLDLSIDIAAFKELNWQETGKLIPFLPFYALPLHTFRHLVRLHSRHPNEDLSDRPLTRKVPDRYSVLSTEKEKGLDHVKASL